MSIDPRGFVYIAQAEAAEFLQSNQVMYNHTAKTIEYSEETVTVTTADGKTITADHVLCTFSAGVLQNTDVVFEPALPDWKMEAINSIEMVSQTLS
jgi:polyamine oxidase